LNELGDDQEKKDRGTVAPGAVDFGINVQVPIDSVIIKQSGGNKRGDNQIETKPEVLLEDPPAHRSCSDDED
jgi:hypothetical protein